MQIIFYSLCLIEYRLIYLIYDDAMLPTHTFIHINTIKLLFNCNTLSDYVE